MPRTAIKFNFNGKETTSTVSKIPVNSAIADLSIIHHQRHEDERGSLERLFAIEVFASAGMDFRAVHINLTHSTHVGTVKGLHMQTKPHEEIKLITCISGRIFDVAVDLRPDSPTYGNWFSVVLSPDKPESLLIPEGFAHGMQCLEPNSIVHYVHSVPYSPDFDSGVNPLDPDIAVAWPLPPRYLSRRDQSLPWFADLGRN